MLQAFGKTIDRQIQEMTRTNETQYFFLQKHVAHSEQHSSANVKIEAPRVRKVESRTRPKESEAAAAVSASLERLMAQVYP